jgi:hypothetical protein
MKPKEIALSCLAVASLLLLAFVAYFDLTHHAVYSKNCTITPDGVKCQLDHYERNK